jgi:hypothetical protein
VCGGEADLEWRDTIFGYSIQSKLIIKESMFIISQDVQGKVLNNIWDARLERAAGMSQCD